MIAWGILCSLNRKVAPDIKMRNFSRTDVIGISGIVATAGGMGVVVSLGQSGAVALALALAFVISITSVLFAAYRLSNSGAYAQLAAYNIALFFMIAAAPAAGSYYGIVALIVGAIIGSGIAAFRTSSFGVTFAIAGVVVYYAVLATLSLLVPDEWFDWIEAFFPWAVLGLLGLGFLILMARSLYFTILRKN